ncbi:hypothetical protein ACJX0J_007837 [Zea mays]
MTSSILGLAGATADYSINNFELFQHLLSLILQIYLTTTTAQFINALLKLLVLVVLPVAFNLKNHGVTITISEWKDACDKLNGMIWLLDALWTNMSGIMMIPIRWMYLVWKNKLSF